jgi:hypothetical protein
MKSPLPAALAAVLLLCAASARADAFGPMERAFDIRLAMDTTPDAARVLRVKQDDVAVLNVRSDRSGEVHLQGYRLQLRVAAGVPAQLRVPATLLGRYGLEFRPVGTQDQRQRHVALGSLEVRPR